MSIHPANHSDTIRQMKETSKLSDTPHKRTLSEHRNRGSAQLRQHANLKGTPSRGGTGQRLPRTLGLPIQACLVPCVIGFCPLGEGGPIRLSCWTVHIACQLPSERVVLCIQHS